MAHELDHAAQTRQQPLRKQRQFRIARTAALIATVIFCTNPATAKPPQEIAEKESDLGELRGRINNLRKDLNASEGSKADAADRLRDSERQISRLQRELHEFSEQRIQLQKNLKDLEQQSLALSGSLDQQQGQLESLLYKQYLRGNPDSLQLLLNGDDPNQMARDLHYLSAIALTRAELMSEVNNNLNKKAALAANTKARSTELAQIEAEQQKRHIELQKQREERKSVYAQVSDKVRSQRKEIGNLQQDEKRLTQLIDRVSKALATQAAKAAKAARAAEVARIAEATQQAEAAKNKARARPAQEEKETPRRIPIAETKQQKPDEAENHYEPVANDGSFGRQKGGLRLPVRGTVAGRFGSPREGGGTWRGLFIKAGTGNDVKAVASGRVVFAEWMRGFGNILIVDHGDAYLSIYGYNDSLLKHVGQAVKGGETVATVGNSGGNPDSGLYFELRHQGQPIDPMKWASLK